MLAPFKPALRRPALLPFLALALALILPALGLALVSLAGLAPAASAAAAAPRFEKAPCWFRMPRDREMGCGFLVVPENRGKDNGREIRLAVVIFEPDKVRHEPLVYLTGGPGQPIYFETSADIDSWWSFIDGEPWLRGRRVVLLDQRGVGLSEPLLDCPGIYDPGTWNGVVATPELKPDLTAGQQQALLRCRDRLLASGVDLTAYNTKENAADVADLRVALDIPEWVVYGISYGTRLGLELLRDHPEGIKAAVLDSVLPLEVDFIGESAATFEGAMERLYADCRADAGCKQAFGDLKPLVAETVRRLDAAPLPLRLTGPNEGPQFIHLDGSTYLWMLFDALYDWDAIERLPFLIYRTAQQDYRWLAEKARASYLDSGADSDFAEAMQFSVGCNEEYPFYNSGPLPKSSALFDGWVEGDFYLWACPLWPAGTADAAENQPARSDVPVLLLSGDYDPITPPAWAQRTLPNLSRGQHLVFRGIGHDVVDSTDCGGEAVADFLANPARKPNTPCVDALEPPYFVLDEADW